MYKVIIVEDDPMVAAINAQYLQSNSLFQVSRSFGNGQDALAWLRKQHTADLAIVDYYMPLLNGLEFIRTCREENLNLDIIMITAANSAAEIADIMRLGVVDYLVKPFTQERFHQAIRKFLNLRGMLRADRNFSQEEIDRLLASSSPAPAPQKLLEKGLQKKTLEMIQEFLEDHTNVYLSSEEIAREIKLSRITVRRYMNYLLENEEIVSQIDYGTGGRPSIKYRKR